MLELAILVIFPLAMLTSASMDMLTMTIPNKISLVLIGGFFLLAPFVGMGWSDFGLHLLAGAAMLLIGMGLFALRWIGGGDAKLFAATGLWIGFNLHLFEYALLAAVFGAILTIALLFFRSLPILAWLVRAPWLARLHDKEEGVPYGVALALAGLVIIKVFLFDMSHLTGFLRALSFIGLGLALVGIGWLYQRVIFPQEGEQRERNA